ncbi:MAG: DsbA family protein [Acidihalobacter sp.]
MSDERPQLRISVFMDYVCPFCFIGSERLLRLENSYDLRVNWRRTSPGIG